MPDSVASPHPSEGGGVAFPDLGNSDEKGTITPPPSEGVGGGLINVLLDTTPCRSPQSPCDKTDGKSARYRLRNMLPYLQVHR